MKKLILFTITLFLLPSCSNLFQSGGYITNDFVSLGKPDKSYCENRCEQYGIKKYGQIDIDKPSVKVGDRKYVDPWCFCMEFCLQLEEPFCNEDSTDTN